MSNIKISVTCPHCEKKHIIEGEEYKKVLFGKYFDKDVVLDFDDIKGRERTKNKNMIPYILIMAYHRAPFDCSHCGQRVKIVHNYNQYNNNENNYAYTVHKSGKNPDKYMVRKMFDYLETKGRGVGKDYDGTKYSKCDKERFLDKLWYRISPKIAKRPFIIRYKGDKHIAYIYRISYPLGWSDTIAIHMVDMCGQTFTVSCSSFELYNDFEYLEFPTELANEIMNHVIKM